eukprot:scaffold13306_cov38-Prasinocladus_malaysianus.AAC.1
MTGYFQQSAAIRYLCISAENPDQYLLSWSNGKTASHGITAELLNIQTARSFGVATPVVFTMGYEMPRYSNLT